MKRTVRSGWTGAALVCGKCSRKLGGGFGDKRRTPLAKALRRLTGGGKGRRAAYGVIETKCLGVCPKGAVMLVDTARPGEWMVVRPTDDLLAVAARLSPVDQAA